MTLPRLPITARVPLIVTLFMIAVSVFASERVLTRLIDSQTRQVQSLADTYLDGLALALVDAIIREDVWQCSTCSTAPGIGPVRYSPWKPSSPGWTVS